eukprot:TRINITY_DN12012_c0_g1_i3.p4 TRINITY_DN12012_c0_g1~~TRINITY_DN12012_c0_g1_i3.p4  ORF type:complete len:103 (+),score=17.82 TRINITY_DN12012_c0_g1_i3:455-763(+)
MPCGHGGICYECSLDLWKRTGECYLCRSEITCVVQIDLQNTFGEYLKVVSETYLDAKQEGQQEEEFEEDMLESSDIQDIQDIYNQNWQIERAENEQQYQQYS